MATTTPSSAAAASAATSTGGHHRPAAPVGHGDGLDDSDNEEGADALSTSSSDPGVIADTCNPSGVDVDPPPSPLPNLNGQPTPQRKRKRRRAEAPGAAGLQVASPSHAKRPLEDSRRLFQRLWTDEDEIVILQGFLDFISRRGAAAAHHDTGPFYDQIKARLQLDFNKNQLLEKLRRLKKKYRNVVNKMSSGKDHAFKTPHGQATFELSRQIWANSIHSRGGGDDDDGLVVHQTPHQICGADGRGVVVTNSIPGKQRSRRRRKRPVAQAAAAAAEPLVLPPEAPVEVRVAEGHMAKTTALLVPNVIGETVRSCLSPMFMELLCSAVGGGGVDGLRRSLVPLSNGCNQGSTSAAVDDKRRDQQILELEVFSKRIELVHEQIKLMLRELRSAG